ncbi:MAG: hypothetical protein ACTHMO_07460 [Rhodanobacteraceae bacterium]
MQEKSIAGYYQFGTCYRYLLDARPEMPVKGDHLVLKNLERFLRQLETLGLTVTKRAASDLEAFCKELEGSQDDETLGDERAKRLRKLTLDLRTTLNAEIVGIKAFVTNTKKIAIENLLGSMKSLFNPGIFERFPEIAAYDFSEAGKCIAFERATAAAFHILRATEANLRHYYKSMIRQKRIASEMWGPIVADLKVRNQTKKHAALNNHLDHIRASFRNPTQHPETVYDIHECQDLLSVCIDVNNRMFKIIDEH